MLWKARPRPTCRPSTSGKEGEGRRKLEKMYSHVKEALRTLSLCGSCNKLGAMLSGAHNERIFFHVLSLSRQLLCEMQSCRASCHTPSLSFLLGLFPYRRFVRPLLAVRFHRPVSTIAEAINRSTHRSDKTRPVRTVGVIIRRIHASI